jgi:hypothetical protein
MGRRPSRQAAADDIDGESFASGLKEASDPVGGDRAASPARTFSVLKAFEESKRQLIGGFVAMATRKTRS